MNNYFITGEMGVGKSTLLARILSTLKVEIAGFTVSRLNAQNKKPLIFRLKKAAELRKKGGERLKKVKTKNISLAKIISEDLNNEIFAYRKDPESKFNLRTEIFDKLGVELLSEKGEIYLMDELGRFELAAAKFQKKVFSLLNSKKIVLAVIKAEENKFLNKIRQRNDIQIYNLKAENQNEIYIQLINNLRNLLNT